MKKLLNKKGSVLFVVVIIMSILIIAASAAYYVVSSGRKNVEVHYGDEQAYQTALSVSDAVSGYIDSYLTSISRSSGRLDGVSNQLVKSMLSLGVGSSFQTTTGTGNLTTQGMGEFEVTIKKLSASATGTGGENTLQTFAITTSAVVNGQAVKITEFKTIETGPASYFSRFFTSTGHIATDVVLGGQQVETTIYLENEYSRFQSSSSWLNADLVSSGSVEDNNSLIYSSSKPISITIANNFYTTGAAGGTSICAGGGTIKVGGDMTTTKPISADTVYVLGDFEMVSNQAIKSGCTVYVNGDCKIANGSTTTGVTFYINGDLIMESNSGFGTFYVGGELTGSKASHVTSRVTFMTDPWSADDVGTTALTIANDSARQTYEEWDAESYFTANFSSAPEITPDLSVTGGVYSISQSCILHPAKLQGWYNDTLIIDATSSDLYILLQPTSGTVFSFGQATNVPMNVVVIGSHSVVFILPDGISFASQVQSYIGHIGWIQLARNNYSSVTNEEIKNLCQNTTNFFQSNRSAITATIAAQLNSDGVVNTSIVSPTNTATNPYMTHNNIFLVTKGGGNIDFCAQQSMFFGYIYAPKSIMKLSPADNRFAFLGGSIVGSYNFKGDFGVMFTLPYDYYNRYLAEKGANWNPSNFIRYLMNDAGSGGSYSSNAGLKGWNTLGYK